MKRNLTGRQFEVLKLIRQEFTSEQISEALGISRRTAEVHRRAIHSIFGTRTPSGAIVEGVRQGIISTNDVSSPIRALSPREIDIIELVAEDMNAAQVAQVLGLAVSTVYRHFERIHAATNTKSLPLAVLVALKAGYIRL
ncbi:MAG: LuxR C-terminal-related transcriptional regulator [Candidatus Devosia phytovorans]|uniref:LuxR C-terminal-related transcriptional regulator n=1 Tax=Candidatus Devosia phytovorans TaxID=3121372 RepID=A0AAJ5VS54_9HYPH|nr:LuxR C-terminal-related transcriptional regulator [Devosia sp.]WEK03252.1 MAG: LuxR C-terminal-related transcriptional regulator [Devosia sp.]